MNEYTAKKIYGNRIDSFSEAEEITQEAFIIYLKKTKKREVLLKSESEVRGYIFGILKNLIKKRNQDLGRVVTVDIDSPEEAPLSINNFPNFFDPESEFAAKEIIAIAKDKLPATQNEVFYMYFVEQRQISEIATILGVCRNTVTNHKKKVIESLREFLATGEDGTEFKDSPGS